LTDGQADSFLVTRPPCIQCRAVKTVVVQTARQKIDGMTSSIAAYRPRALNEIELALELLTKTNLKAFYSFHL